MNRTRVLDTLAVARALGPLPLAGALVRRLGSEIRAIRRARTRPGAGVAAPEVARYTVALRVSPSPLAEDGDEHRLHTLEREQPGICALIRERALTAADGVEDELGRPVVAIGDPRLSWETSRLARLVAIGCGARVAGTQGDRPAEVEALLGAFERGALAWIEANPRGLGSAWASPLEAALRAWNLWVGVSLVRAPSLSERAARAIATTLAEHALEIEARLEDRGVVVGSHLLGELAGLYACGTALGAAGGEPSLWRATARTRLEIEARAQILADGGGAEGSTGYGRFVTELLLASLVTARARGELPPPSVLAAVMRSMRFLAGVMTPDGRDPGIGDDDDSKVLPPAVASEAGDLASLLPLGAALAALRERPLAVPWSETAAWLGGSIGYRRFTAARAVAWPQAWCAPAFGLAVAREGGSGGDLVLLRAGPHGQQGVGGHAHNDALAVSVWFGGRPVVVDPGTAVYLGRPALRDRFRGVAAHATLCVDGAEPSPIPATRPFALPDRTRARLTATGEDGRAWGATAVHDGWNRLGVRHRRELAYDRRTRTILVTDTVDGSGEHELALSFPLGAEAEVDGQRVRVGEKDFLEILDRGGPPWRLDPASVSPRYGQRAPAVVARRVGRVMLPVVWKTRLGATE